MLKITQEKKDLLTEKELFLVNKLLRFLEKQRKDIFVECVRRQFIHASDFFLFFEKTRYDDFCIKNKRDENKYGLFLIYLSDAKRSLGFSEEKLNFREPDLFSKKALTLQSFNKLKYKENTNLSASFFENY